MIYHKINHKKLYAMDKYFKECYVEKIYHFDGLEKLNDMNEYSTMLYLVANDDEPYKDQVKVSDSNKEDGQIIGVLSKDDGNVIYDIVKNGWKDIFKVVVLKINKDGGEDKTLKVVIKILDNNQK